MNVQHSPTNILERSDMHHGSETRLCRRRLMIARSGWIAAAALVLGLFFVSLPPYLAHLQAVCVHQPCTYYQLTPGNARALQALGISVGGYVAFTAAFNALIALVLFVVGGVLAWRKSDDWMALLVAFMLVALAAGTGIGDGYTKGQAAYGLPATLLNSLGSLTIFLVFLLFPSGRFVPRWGWCFLLIFLITAIPHQYFSNWPFSLAGWSTLLNILGFIGSILSVPLTQIYRYWRVSTLVQRQQTKWIVIGITLLIIVLLGSLIIFLKLSGSLYDLVYSAYVINAASLLIPLSFAIAILRYRLWEIDAIINKALVYGLLTALLAGVYAGLVLGLQALLGGLLHQTNAIALVVSTLVIAALFQPLRRRIQRVIDRRFYRSKYDAAKIVAAYSATLRQEVDLDQLRDHLLAVVQETMQPAHVSLWLRKSEQEGKHPAPWRADPRISSSEK